MGRDEVSDLLLAGPRGRQCCWDASREVGPDGYWLDGQDELDGLRSRSPALAGGLDVDDALSVLEGVVMEAAYWQPPSDVDRMLSTPVAIEGLQPHAHALAAAPGTVWWDRPVQLDDLQHVSWITGPTATHAKQPQLAGRAKQLEAWPKVAEGHGTVWSSAPDTGTAIPTTSSLGSLPALGLVLREDDPGLLTRARVRRLQPTSGVRIYEIAGPLDWVELVNAYPLDVTASRGAAWAKCTEQQSLRWLQPDWRAASRDYDATHLTTLGYLSTAGRALAADDGDTVLAGWSPDCTFWLTETLTRTDQDTLWTSDDQGRVWTHQGN